MPVYTPFEILKDISIQLAGLPQLKKIDIDLGQYKKDGRELIFDYPGVILRNENIEWRDNLGLVHTRLKLFYPFTAEREYFIYELIRTEVESFYSLVTSIEDTIALISSGYHSQLIRFNECHLFSEPTNDDTGLRQWVYCIDYVCNIHLDGTDIAPELDYDAVNIRTFNAIYERTEHGKYERWRTLP